MSPVGDLRIFPFPMRFAGPHPSGASVYPRRKGRPSNANWLDTALMAFLLPELVARAGCSIKAPLSAQFQIQDGLTLVRPSGQECLDAAIQLLPVASMSPGLFDVRFYEIRPAPKRRPRAAPPAKNPHTTMEASVLLMRPCYLESLTTDADAAGRIEFGIEVGPEGAVTRTEVLDSTLQDPALAACVEDQVSALIFAPPPDGQPLPLEYGYAFSTEKGIPLVGLIWEVSDPHRPEELRSGALDGVDRPNVSPLWDQWEALERALRLRVASLYKCLDSDVGSVLITLGADGSVSSVENLAGPTSTPGPTACAETLKGIRMKGAPGRLAFRFDGRTALERALVPDHRFDARPGQTAGHLRLDGVLVSPYRETHSARGRLGAAVVARGVRDALSASDCQPEPGQRISINLEFGAPGTRVSGLTYGCIDAVMASVAAPASLRGLTFHLAIAVLGDKPDKPPPLRGFLPLAHRKVLLDEARFVTSQCLLDAPEARGDLVVDFTIGEDGRVSDVQQTGKSRYNGYAADCIVSTLRRVRFAPPFGGGTIDQTQAYRF